MHLPLLIPLERYSPWKARGAGEHADCERAGSRAPSLLARKDKSHLEIRTPSEIQG